MAEMHGGGTPARLVGLDGLRAVAVVGVIGNHSGLFDMSWVGVDVFFALSGYLITGILLDAKAAATGPRAYFVPFYARRALRILPVAVVVAVLVCLWRGKWSGLPWYLGYVVNWLPRSPQPFELRHYWSLAVEEQFYLLWPAVVLFCSRRALWRATLGLIAADVVLRFVIAVWSPDFATLQFQTLATYVRADSLLLGALLAQRQRERGWPSTSRFAPHVAVVAGLALFFFPELERLHLPRVVTYTVLWPTVAVFSAAALLWVLTRDPAVLRWAPLRWLGRISYGVYVIHAVYGPWLHATFGAPYIRFILQLGLTIPVAAVSWYLLESPLLKLKSRFPMPREPAATTAPGLPNHV